MMTGRSRSLGSTKQNIPESVKLPPSFISTKILAYNHYKFSISTTNWRNGAKLLLWSKNHQTDSQKSMFPFRLKV